MSRTWAADRYVQRHHPGQGYHGSERRIGPAGAKQPADHLGPHAGLPSQFRLGQAENTAPFIQGPDHAVDGGDP